MNAPTKKAANIIRHFMLDETGPARAWRYAKDLIDRLTKAGLVITQKKPRKKAKGD